MGTELTPSLGLGTRRRQSKATGLPHYAVSLITAPASTQWLLAWMETQPELPDTRGLCCPGVRQGLDAKQGKSRSAHPGDVTDTPGELVVRSWSRAGGDASFASITAFQN